MAFPYSGYARCEFTGKYQEVIVGIGLLAGGMKTFIAEETVLYCTEDCWVQWKEDEEPAWYPKGVYWEWYRRVPKVWIKSDGTNGRIHFWFEGHTRQ